MEREELKNIDEAEQRMDGFVPDTAEAAGEDMAEDAAEDAEDNMSEDSSPVDDRPRNKRNGTTNSLCGYCGNACNSGCSWSDRLEPVEGWDAVENKRGWFVMDCPEFCDDNWMHEHPEDLDTEGCLQLLSAVLKALRDDYILMPRSRGAIERFIRSKEACALFQFSDPENIIRQMRKGMRRGL